MHIRSTELHLTPQETLTEAQRLYQEMKPSLSSTQKIMLVSRLIDTFVNLTGRYPTQREIKKMMCAT